MKCSIIDRPTICFDHQAAYCWSKFVCDVDPGWPRPSAKCAVSVRAILQDPSTATLSRIICWRSVARWSKEMVHWTYQLLNTSFIVMLIKKKNMEWHAIHDAINGNMRDCLVIRVEADTNHKTVTHILRDYQPRYAAPLIFFWFFLHLPCRIKFWKVFGLMHELFEWLGKYILYFLWLLYWRRLVFIWSYCNSHSNFIRALQSGPVPHMAAGVRINRYKGKPGDEKFRYKLPKGITKESISYALNLIVSAHKEVPDGLIKSDFYLGELTQIYPDLNIEISRHFVLSRAMNVIDIEPDDSDVSVTSDDNGCTQNQSVDNATDQSDYNDDSSNQCQLCNLHCEANERICMRCKCMNQRIDQLSMDLEKVQHAIEALLDAPQRDASTSSPNPTRKSQNSNPQAASLEQHCSASNQHHRPTHQASHQQNSNYNQQQSSRPIHYYPPHPPPPSHQIRPNAPHGRNGNPPHPNFAWNRPMGGMAPSLVPPHIDFNQAPPPPPPPQSRLPTYASVLQAPPPTSRMYHQPHYPPGNFDPPGPPMYRGNPSYISLDVKSAVNQTTVCSHADTLSNCNVANAATWDTRQSSVNFRTQAKKSVPKKLTLPNITKKTLITKALLLMKNLILMSILNVSYTYPKAMV